MDNKNPAGLHLGNFDNVIKLFETKSKDLQKTNPDKAKKWKAAAVLFKGEKERLKTIIEKLKAIKLEDDRTFYDAYVSGKDDFVSFERLSELLSAHRGDIKEESLATVDGLDLSTKTQNTRYDIIDYTKKVAKDLTTGGSLSKKIQKGCLFTFFGELLSQGITSALVKRGVMDYSMGLIGLGKLGIQKAPLLLPYLEQGAMMIAGMPQLALIAGGAFLVMKGIPLIKRSINKVKEKMQNAKAVDKKYEEIVMQQNDPRYALAGA